MFELLTVKSQRTDSLVNRTCKTLFAGGLVVFPSDTVYGLLVDAKNEEAVQKLIRFKNRPIGKAISVFVASLSMLEQTVNIPPAKLGTIKHLLPGPFTIILESKHRVSKLLESEKGTLGVRIPNYPLIQQLMQKFGKPVTATSANLGGKSPHYSIRSLLHQLPKQKQKLIDLIVDAGSLPRNKPSTVIDLIESKMKILRQGDIVFSDKQSFISKSPAQTQKIGKYLADQQVKSSKGKPIVIILKGDLGSGKTVMAKGIASYFGINNIISPTFVVYYEYDIEPLSHESRFTSSKLQVTSYKKFVHVDLYNVEEREEFDYLGLDNYLKKGNVLVVEWGEKLGELYNKFKSKSNIVYISIIYKGEGEREIKIES